MHSDSSPEPEPLLRDPSEPLPGEVTPVRRHRFRLGVAGILLVGLGGVLGLAVAPESNIEAQERIAKLETDLTVARDRINELDRALKYKTGENVNRPGGKLKPADRLRHERESKKYVKVLRLVKAQSAAELMQWFVNRWNGLLDAPEINDRVGRRAEVLSQLIGAMAQNLDPADFVPWQAELLNANWLGELNFDMDGDGLPGKRSMANPHDGFTNMSVCHIAMALNQAARDARVLVMPDMQCDRPELKMSVFLQGTTLDDALTDFVQALRREGFVAVERTDHGVRLLLVGKGNRGQGG